VILPEDRKPIVLVVDDEPINIQILASLLNREYEVKVASDGLAALAIAARMPQPDLILLDIMMPGMDGFEVCKNLKADAHTRDIPVIFVTAAGAESEAKCFELGAADYIAKPLNAKIMRLRVRTHLDIVRLRKVQQESLAFLRNMIDNAPLMIAVISRQDQ
jgi:putative two-component system response regulator